MQLLKQKSDLFVDKTKHLSPQPAAGSFITPTSPLKEERNSSFNNPTPSNQDPVLDQKEHRKEDDFLFGSISAAKLSEFLVTKINRRGKRQTRVLGIDGFNITNIRKNKTKQALNGT